MSYCELVASIAGLGIPFDAYHIDGYYTHETICIPSKDKRCCEILYYPDKVEVNGFKCIKTYKTIDKESLNDIFETILKTMNKRAL